jgi:hypothetical protein
VHLPNMLPSLAGNGVGCGGVYTSKVLCGFGRCHTERAQPEVRIACTCTKSDANHAMNLDVITIYQISLAPVMDVSPRYVPD